MGLRAVQLEMPDDERGLIERARAGDEEAFRMLMDRHRENAYAVALRITRSPADADDVTQQAFVRAWFALEKFRGESSFGTWLHKIVARRALDRAAQMKSRETDQVMDDTLSATDQSRDVILIARLQKLMVNLTPAQRAVVTLHYWDDLSVADVAAALRMPVNTVKTHLSRSRKTLREEWLRLEGQR